MTPDAIPVLWLCGPPGVGKTAVGWEVYAQLRGSGIQAGYVDIDQLGICFPEPPADPGRHRMQARNLDAVVANFRAAGARCVVVSGVVDADRGIHTDLIPHVALTSCRLRADREELRQRYLGRRWQVDQVDHVLTEADVLDAGAVADVCVDTSGRTVAEVAAQVWERTGGWPALTTTHGSSAAGPPTGHRASAADGTILWLCGATGVGKSTVGFAVYQKVLGTGPMAAYIDVDQLGFCGPKPADHRVRARNLAAVWRTYRAAGAQRLVVVGPVPDEATATVYADALPAATLTLCRLHAGRERLTSRVMSRGRGGSWSAPGDPLVGRSTTYLLRIADRAAADAAALERAGIGLRIDTDGHSVEEAVDAILTRSRWPDRAG